MQNETTKARKFSLFDVSGESTGIPLTKQKLIYIVAGIAAPFLCSLLPLQAYGEKAGLAIGLFVMILVFLFGKVCSTGIAATIFGAASIATGCLNITAFQQGVGGTIFFTCLGLGMLGYGIESTPIGYRLTYLLLKKFGQKPKRLIACIVVLCAVLSSFLSNIAVIMIMSSVVSKLLESIGMERKKSNFAKAAMLAVAYAGAIGGVGFVQGTMGMSLLGIGACAQLGYGITNAQWAMISWPILVVMMVVMALVCVKFFPFSSKDLNLPEESYYEQKLQELGPINGDEVRWIFFCIVVIAVMLTDVNSNLLMLITMCICCFPGIGFMKMNDAVKKAIPWELIIATMSFSMMGTVMSNCGVSAFITSLVTPLLGDMHPILLTILIGLLGATFNNVLVGAGFLTYTIFVAGLAPVVLGMGYNPMIILYPVIFLMGTTICFYPNPALYANYVYGWYEEKAPIVPGMVINIAFVVVSAVALYFFAPAMWGTTVLI